MTLTPQPSDQADRGHISFEIFAGNQRVSCRVLDEALEAAAGLASPATLAARRQSFQRFRVLIHAAATLKFARSGKASDVIVMLGSEDLRHVPPEKGVPVFGKIPRDTAVISE
ncbi:DUF1488 family protein [Acetobacter oeni]|uniref:DUF1488 domain-containing protein n=1 Tax=Acetobacter oeni TaxID=304077 RepID=A0A511XLA3_9PROT|nr:DUF1488 family protein [Acetobacter oeni]MBB3883504.1 hypothetical protein [Acetobacter oeni]NHO19545.1 DUF1488 family protein [Acetobacter oeni]GBR03182.1 hypothetical protein AA21952_0982 [Acetobacter oeni LMG 21952]GEN63725.1 hypothetical protein AOE01nite_19490 [Acetobacter oeni]